MAARQRRDEDGAAGSGDRKSMGTAVRKPQAVTIETTFDALGGAKTFGGLKISSPLEVHDALAAGLKKDAAITVIESLSVLDPGEAVGAMGMSQRTYARLKSDKSGRLDAERSSRTWKFAEILARATSAFGSQVAAERWLDRPAIGLDGKRPIELLATQPGTELVQEYLERIDYGAYS